MSVGTSIVEIHLLGGFALIRDGVPLTRPWRRSTARTLLKVLAVSPGHRARRETVLEACWPGVDPATAGPHLRAALHAARRHLATDSPADEYLSWSGEHLVLHHVRVDLDEALAAARSALRTGDRAAAAEALVRLREDPLPEDRYAEWLAATTAQVAALRHRLGGLLTAAPPPGWRPAAVQAADPPMRGRQRVLALVTSSASPVLLVSGEAGLGKTRLLAEAARTASADGAVLLWGAAHDAEDPMPYGPFAEALLEYVNALPASARELVPARHPGLRRLLSPTVADRTTAADRPDRTADEPAAERTRLFQAVAAFLAELGDVRLVLDDLHAADLGSFRLLYHLARSGRPGGLRILAALRAEEMPSADPRTGPLTALLAQGLATRIELPRLPVADCLHVVRDVQAVRDVPGIAGEEDLRTCAELADGNPLFARELATAPEQAAALRTGAGTVPQRVAHLTGRRLERLDRHSRDLAELIAVADARLRLDELAAAAAGLGTRDDLTERLDELVRSGLIAEYPTAGEPSVEYSFRHPLIRLACLDRLTVTRRRLLHGLIGEALLERRGIAVERLAVQLSRADDPRAIGYLRRAADRAAALDANDAADRYFGDLVDRLDRYGSPATEARLAWGAVLSRLGAYDRAAAVLGAAWRVHRAAGAEPAAVRVAVDLAEVLQRAGRARDGRTVLATHADPGRGLLAARFHLAAAIVEFGIGDYAAALAGAGRAERLAGTDAEVRARALHTRAIATVMLGRTETAAVVAEDAHRWARRSGNPLVESSTVTLLGNFALLGGDLPAARKHLGQALELAELAGDVGRIAYARSEIVRLRVAEGRPVAALRLAEQAVQLARGLGRPWCLPYTLLSRARAALAVGRSAEAAADLAEARRLGEAIGDRQVVQDAAALQVGPAPAMGTNG